jgi:hypothetical protein
MSAVCPYPLTDNKLPPKTISRFFPGNSHADSGNMLLLKSLLYLLEFCLFYFLNRKSIIPKIALILQENQRYKRYFQQKKIKLPFTIQKKWFIRSMFISNPKARRYFTLVTPETILYKWKKDH